MRIISGTHKGRTINPPKNLPVRPTTDFAKTGLFNILNNYFDFEKISALDLFCGTGNISYEFASRSAVKIYSVDENYNCIKFINETSEKFGFSNIKSFKNDAFSFLKNCRQKFDIIFADPPYEMKETGKIPELIFEKELLNENGWFILEHSKRVDFSNHPNYFETRNYGEVHYSFFKD